MAQPHDASRQQSKEDSVLSKGQDCAILTRVQLSAQTYFLVSEV